jgi:hypothetical protein
MTKFMHGLRLPLALMTFALSLLPVSAEELQSGHPISKVTKYDDGVQILDYADNSGFEVIGGGGRFIFDYNTRVTTFLSGDVCVTFSSDGQLDSRSTDPSTQLAEQ